MANGYPQFGIKRRSLGQFCNNRFQHMVEVRNSIMRTLGSVHIKKEATNNQSIYLYQNIKQYVPSLRLSGSRFFKYNG